MIANMGGRGAGRAIAPRRLTAQQQLRPPGIGRLDELPNFATAPIASSGPIKSIELKIRITRYPQADAGRSYGDSSSNPLQPQDLIRLKLQVFRRGQLFRRNRVAEKSSQARSPQVITRDRTWLFTEVGDHDESAAVM